MKRKLTAKVAQFLYQNRWKVKKSDYAGEALQYLNRLRAASKGAKTRINNTLKVGATKIPRNSELYRIVKKSAELKGVTVKQFAKQNKSAIEQLAGKGTVHITREADYVILDMAKAHGVYVNGELMPTVKAQYLLQQFKSTFVEQSNAYPILNIEHHYDLRNNLYIEFPMPDQYERFSEKMDGEELQEHWREFIDKNYPLISYIPND